MTAGRLANINAGIVVCETAATSRHGSTHEGWTRRASPPTANSPVEHDQPRTVRGDDHPLPATACAETGSGFKAQPEDLMARTDTHPHQDASAHHHACWPDGQA